MPRDKESDEFEAFDEKLEREAPGRNDRKPSFEAPGRPPEKPRWSAPGSQGAERFPEDVLELVDDRLEAYRERIDFLEDHLTRNEPVDEATYEEHVAPLRDRHQRLRGRLADVESGEDLEHPDDYQESLMEGARSLEEDLDEAEQRYDLDREV